MTGRARLALAALITLIPFGRVRRALYRGLLGYRIGAGCRIGMFNLIACRSLDLGAGSTIGRGNTLKGDFDMTTGPRFFMGNGNVLTCPWRLAARAPTRGYATRITFGENCLVNDRHFFDAHGAIDIGDGSWIAGRDSQFYTHGASTTDRDITIGHTCYVGSAVRFAPGAGIADDTIVGLGAVVTARIETPAVLLGGVPARILRDITAERAAGLHRFSKDDWGDDRP